jgi:hypothetical protein
VFLDGSGRRLGDGYGSGDGSDDRNWLFLLEFERRRNAEEEVKRTKFGLLFLPLLLPLELCLTNSLSNPKLTCLSKRELTKSMSFISCPLLFLLFLLFDQVLTTLKLGYFFTTTLELFLSEDAEFESGTVGIVRGIVVEGRSGDVGDRRWGRGCEKELGLAEHICAKKGGGAAR